MGRILQLTMESLKRLEDFARPALRNHVPENFFLPQYQLALGTVVHATPLVEALRQTLPNARIVVAASGLAAQVWQGNPHLDTLLRTPSPLQDVMEAVRQLRRARLFEGKPYITLLTTGNERTKITAAAMLAGPSCRIGFAVHGGLIHTHLRFDPQQSQIENNLRLLTATGVQPPSRPSIVEPRIYPDAASTAYASSVLEPTSSGATRSGPRIALATQTSITQRKKWLDERWIELAHALRQRYDADLIFVGTEGEAPAILALQQRIGFTTTSIAGRTTIPQLAAVFARCDLGIMLDTGPLHVGRAVGLPTVVIAPAWSPAHEWLPIHNPRYRILKNADFPPPAPDDYIIDEVSVADVLSAAASLLPRE